MRRSFLKFLLCWLIPFALQGRDFATDARLQGAEPFSLRRAYISADTSKKGLLGKSWGLNYFAIAKRWEDDRTPNLFHALVIEEYGATHHYRSKGRDDFRLTWDTFSNGATNCGSGMMSARTNIVNNRFQRQKQDKTCILTQVASPTGILKWGRGPISKSLWD